MMFVNDTFAWRRTDPREGWLHDIYEGNLSVEKLYNTLNTMSRNTKIVLDRKEEKPMAVKPVPLVNISIKKVIYNGPATIVYWNDGSKTVVKCREGEVYSKETGLAMAMCKHILGGTGLHKMFKDFCEVE